MIEAVPINMEIPEESRILIVTGVSGAGKSSALRALEDLGYEAIDNVPISLLDRLIAGGGPPQRVAVGVDIWTRDFDAADFVNLLESMNGGVASEIELLFVDCGDDVLVQRFKETRRRHPLAVDRPINEGIRRERRLMAPLRARADLVLDTSELALGDLKMALDSRFGLRAEPGLSVFVSSFGFKKGLPRDSDLVFDVRFLRNPYYDTELRELTGRDERVAAFIQADDAFGPFFEKIIDLLDLLLGRYEAEGKSYLNIAMGCTGGRHRSVFVTESLARWLRGRGINVHLRHRDLDKTEI